MIALHVPEFLLLQVCEEDFQLSLDLVCVLLIWFVY